MAGHYSEYILDTKLRNIQAGITIPFQGNVSAPNTAKDNLVYTESDPDRF